MSSIPSIAPNQSILHSAKEMSACWSANETGQTLAISKLPDLLRDLRQAFCVVENTDKQLTIATGGSLLLDGKQDKNEFLLCRAIVPPQKMMALGDPAFCEEYAVNYPYMAGSMANGIASVELVEALAKANILASFGAAGLTINEIDDAIQRLQQSLGNKPFASNLIYTPNEKGHEDAVVDLYLKYGVKLVETSAYMKLTLPVVRYRLSGIHRNDEGEVIVPNRIIAKASRIEIARQWFSPPPEKLVKQLLEQGVISEEQAEMAAHIPMAQDLTVEADSGGHTDNRPAITLIPTILALRDQLQNQFSYKQTLRVGAAGGIATPASALAAFAMGAAYIVTGTVNQACIESGSSDTVRQMLAAAEQADVTMAPAVDMFEMGVKLQVLKRGTMFAMRGNKLYDIYKEYDSIETIPLAERQKLEKTVFKMSLDEVWNNTREFFNERDPAQVNRAEQQPKHKMALIFRWYLGLSSRWANAGVEDRQVDYQIWCGPAMGAFNEWTRGSFLEQTSERNAVTVAMNIMFGAAVLNRVNILNKQGVTIEDDLVGFSPMSLNEIQEYLAG